MDSCKDEERSYKSTPWQVVLGVLGMGLVGALVLVLGVNGFLVVVVLGAAVARAWQAVSDWRQRRQWERGEGR